MVSAGLDNERRSGYDAARHGAAFCDRSDRGFIVVSGTDRASYLHGLFTNDITALAPGAGCYSAYLTPQGRMIADLWVYELGDVMLLVASSDVKATLLAKLDQFIFTEDVQLGDVSDTFTCVAVVGPMSAKAASDALTGVDAERLTGLSEHANVRARFEDHDAIVTRITDTGEPGYDVFVETSQQERLTAALSAASAVEIDSVVADVLRIEGGVPKFHHDMDEETIPLEAGLESRAISMTKGCYVGQEVIIRVLHRGHGRIARKLVGLTLGGVTTPRSGAAVQAEGRNIGHVTSGARSPALMKPIALAYVHRDFVGPGTQVMVEEVPAVVTSLPFVQRPNS